MDDNANSGFPVSGTSDPSTSLDNPDNWNFVDPEDEEIQANPQTSEEGTEGETDETEDGQEADDDTSQDDEETEDEDAASDDDAAEIDESKLSNVEVTLQDGSKHTLEELKTGFMMRRDYQTKTSELAVQRKRNEELQTRLSATADAFAEFLSKQIPDPPDQTLAFTDPGKFVQQKAVYEAAMAQIGAVLEMGGKAKEVGTAISEEQRVEALRAEDAKLRQSFPQTANPDGRKKFFDQAFAGAQALGISPDELNAITDHRAYGLAYYARIGMQAEAARKKAKAKVADVPPVQPAKRQKGSAETVARKNRDAMKRLAKSGSIHDAMMIDFE